MHILHIFYTPTGDRQQISSFHVNISRGSNNRDEISYFSPQGQRYKKKIDVVRFLGLSPIKNGSKNTGSKSSASKSLINKGRPRNARDCEFERRRLKKEIDKLLKAHGKTSKSLDDLRNEHSNDMNPIDDTILMEQNEGGGEETSNKVIRVPDMNGFPGLPTHCTGEVLMVWDFLCTFFRVLSLEPISLDDFVSLLSYVPQKSAENDMHINDDHDDFSIPVYLAEAHLALLKLLLTDQSSDEWWWSTLESDMTRPDEEIEVISAESNAKLSDASAPVVKIDMAALLSVEEDPTLTTRWLQALEDVRIRKTNSGGPIKSAVKSAASITTNPLVKLYLKKSMRKWKGNAAGFTKRAVIWLIERVREARPDLWGKQVSKEIITEQTTKVAKEAAAIMDLFEEEAEMSNENESNLEEGSDDEDESDEESDEDGEDFVDDEEETRDKDSVVVARRKQINHDTPVTSPIPIKPPPTIVDLLLPPAKPTFTSDIVTPLTWPALVGASACRILHRYKRQRNEVDDELREFHSVQPLTIGERLKREKRAAERIFSETTYLDPNFSKSNLFTVEQAIDHVCIGNSYLDIPPILRLCLLRILMEAAYDTHKITKAIDENFRSRINAIKSLELEEKRAKREAREEAAATDRAARERLAEERKQNFISKKRNEILRNNRSPSEIENLPDENIIDYDEDTRQAYASLPKPESFNKTEVNAMVSKINEESAFEANSVLVLSMDEIISREEDNLEVLESRLKTYGDIEALYESGNIDRETSAKIDKLQNQIEQIKQSNYDLPGKRTEAVDNLKDAIEEGTVKDLKFAIKTAKLAKLFGVEESNEDVWALDLLRDAALELRIAERRRRVTEAQKDLVAKRNKCFIRTYPLGQDRYRNNVWHFDNDSCSRVWTETNYNIVINDSEKDIDETNQSLPANEAIAGATDEEHDFCPNNLISLKESNRSFFGRKEYHPSGLLHGLPKRYWGSHITEKSLRSLMKNCDQRGIRESGLKQKLKEILEAKGQANMDASFESKNTRDTLDELSNDEQHEMEVGNSFQSFGDEKDFSLVRNNARLEGHDIAFVASKISAIGERIRHREIFNSNSSSDSFSYDMGTVVGWSPSSLISGGNDLENEISDDSVKVAAWRVHLDNGNSIDISGIELIQGLRRATLWTNNDKRYMENDSKFLCYRNSMGRFCGRQIDAPFAASPFFFAKQMIKREAEFYAPLKNRSNWNEWGGRSAARNAWLNKMKDPNVNLYFVRDGLLTLETAFFQMSGGFEALTNTENDMVESNSFPSGKELLQDESYRFDIELESITGVPKSLWNSREARAIFLEIIHSKCLHPICLLQNQFFHRYFL